MSIEARFRPLLLMHHDGNSGQIHTNRSEKDDFGIVEIAYGRPPELSETTSGWNEIAPTYESEFRSRDDSRLEVVEIPSFLARCRPFLPGRTVANIGSGPFIFEERRIFNSDDQADWPAEYWGVDPSGPMWEIALKRIQGKSWADRIVQKVQGAEENSIPENYFDLIMATYSLENASEPRRALENVYRWLKPGGMFAAIFKDEERNIRYLSQNKIDFRKLLQALGVEGVFVREKWQGSGDEAVWAYYAQEKTWRRWMKEIGYVRSRFEVPSITEEIVRAYPQQAIVWLEHGNSGVIVTAMKPFK